MFVELTCVDSTEADPEARCSICCVNGDGLHLLCTWLCLRPPTHVDFLQSTVLRLDVLKIVISKFQSNDQDTGKLVLVLLFAHSLDTFHLATKCGISLTLLMIV